MITIVLAYFFILTITVVVGVVVRLKVLRSRHTQYPFTFSVDENDSADQDVDDLCIERAGSMVPTQALSKRGSWRVALDQVMFLTDFEEMKTEEYQKRL